MNNDKFSKTHSTRDKSLYSPSVPCMLPHALKITATLRIPATAHFTPLHSSKSNATLNAKPLHALKPQAKHHAPYTPPITQAQSNAPTPPSKHSPHASQNLIPPRTPIKPHKPLSSTIFGFCFILFVFMGFAILRPIRDTLGLHSGQEALRWLFGATFMASIALFVLCSYVASRVSRRRFVDMIFLFFMLCLGAFYALFSVISRDSSAFSLLAWGFYVWVSVCNVASLSTAWSVIVDVFDRQAAARSFGIISAGASLGSIAGVGLVGLLSVRISVEGFCLAAIMLLFSALVCKGALLRHAPASKRFYSPIAGGLFGVLKVLITSRQWLLFLLFILLLTGISTFLYMEQARLVSLHFHTQEARIRAFALLDSSVQIASLVCQIFVSGVVLSRIPARIVLLSFGVILAGGFAYLSLTHPAFAPFAVVMCLRRVGEYALIKPLRELLFVPLNAEAKYKIKNFFDTIIYRAGDALSAQCEGWLSGFGIELALGVGALMAFIWGVVGYGLGRASERA